MHENHTVLFDSDHPGALNIRRVGTGVSWWRYLPPITRQVGLPTGRVWSRERLPSWETDINNIVFTLCVVVFIVICVSVSAHITLCIIYDSHVMCYLIMRCSISRSKWDITAQWFIVSYCTEMNTIYIYNPDLLLPQEWAESGMPLKMNR